MLEIVTSSEISTSYHGRLIFPDPSVANLFKSIPSLCFLVAPLFSSPLVLPPNVNFSVSQLGQEGPWAFGNF